MRPRRDNLNTNVGLAAVLAIVVSACATYDESLLQGKGGAPAGGASGTGGLGGASGSGGVLDAGGAGGTGGSIGGGSGGLVGGGGAGGEGGSGGLITDAGPEANAGGGAGGAGGAVGGAGGTDASVGGAGGTGGAGGGVGGAGGVAGAGGASGAGGGTCVGVAGPKALPFAVDEFFNVTGWLGVPQAKITAAGCPTRAPGLLGLAKCWVATYSPMADGGMFGGILWQYPDNNWGALPGRIIPAGATKVSFYAWAPAADVGKTVKFEAGYPDTDGFQVFTTVTLKATPTAYTIPLTGVDYTCKSVRLGFEWFSDSATGATFYIDNIQWQ